MKSAFLTSAVAFAFFLAAIPVASADSPNGVPHNYPLKKCVVSGDPLGEHGKVFKVSYHGTDVYLCCRDCVNGFQKDPAKYVKMVKSAETKR